MASYRVTVAGERTIRTPTLDELSFAEGTEHEVGLIIREIFDEREYLGEATRLDPGDVVVDVGANIGLFAIFADQVCEGRCRICCFEPIPRTAGHLRKNLEHFGLGDRVETVELGLTRGDGPREVDFTYLRRSPGGTTMKWDEKNARLKARWGRELQGRSLARRVVARLLDPLLRPRWFAKDTVRCRLTTLTEACDSMSIDRIDLLKIDVEDAELDVLHGIDDATWAIVKQIVMEIHLPERVDEAVRILDAQGFALIERTPMAWSDDTFRLFASKDG